MSSSLDHCSDLVKINDIDRYYAMLFAPQDKRSAVFSLLACNSEIAKIRETITEPVIGEMKMQWWRDALDDMKNGKIRNHPIIEEMAKYDFDLKLYTIIENIINARSDTLYNDKTATWASMISYIEITGGQLGQAILLAQGCKNSEIIQKAYHLGCAWAAIGLLRALSFHAATGQAYLPDMPAKQSMTDDQIKQLQPTIKKLCDYAEQESDLAKSDGAGIGAEYSALFLLQGQLRRYITAIKKAEFHAFCLSDYSETKFRQLWVLLKTAFLKTY